LPLQQQSVLLLASRGPDGIAKFHPSKVIQRAYRATVFMAGRYGRMLRFGEKADTFMSLEVFGSDTLWKQAVTDFFDHEDDLPHHFIMHLMHGVEILGYKHPDPMFRERWHGFYLRLVRDLHLTPETEAEMDKRLGDWGRAHWGDDDFDDGQGDCA
jgi:hypothetical protein